MAFNPRFFSQKKPHSYENKINLLCQDIKEERITEANLACLEKELKKEPMLLSAAIKRPEVMAFLDAQHVLIKLVETSRALEEVKQSSYMRNNPNCLNALGRINSNKKRSA